MPRNGPVIPPTQAAMMKVPMDEPTYTERPQQNYGRGGRAGGGQNRNQNQNRHYQNQNQNQIQYQSNQNQNQYQSNQNQNQNQKRDNQVDRSTTGRAPAHQL